MFLGGGYIYTRTYVWVLHPTYRIIRITSMMRIVMNKYIRYTHSLSRRW